MAGLANVLFRIGTYWATVLDRDNGRPALPLSAWRLLNPLALRADSKWALEFRAAYRAFVDAFRAGALRLRERARKTRDMFPLCAFPPQLPFKEAA